MGYMQDRASDRMVLEGLHAYILDPEISQSVGIGDPIKKLPQHSESAILV